MTSHLHKFNLFIQCQALWRRSIGQVLVHRDDGLVVHDAGGHRHKLRVVFGDPFPDQSDQSSLLFGFWTLSWRSKGKMWKKWFTKCHKDKMSKRFWVNDTSIQLAEGPCYAVVAYPSVSFAGSRCRASWLCRPSSGFGPSSLLPLTAGCTNQDELQVSNAEKHVMIHHGSNQKVAKTILWPLILYWWTLPYKKRTTRLMWKKTLHKTLHAQRLEESNILFFSRILQSRQSSAFCLETIAAKQESE